MEIQEMQKHLFDLAEKSKDSETTKTLKETCRRLNLFLPMKPRDITYFQYSPDIAGERLGLGICPTCGCTCTSDMKHCDGCGQSLDWTDEERTYDTFND